MNSCFPCEQTSYIQLAILELETQLHLYSNFNLIFKHCFNFYPAHFGKEDHHNVF